MEVTILALFAAGRHDILQRDKLLVDFFSPSSFNDRVIRLAAEHARLAASAVFVEQLISLISLSWLAGSRCLSFRCSHGELCRAISVLKMLASV